MKKHGHGKQRMEHVKRQCVRCRGSGRTPCQICGGKGQVAKGRDIHGNTLFNRCTGCFGTKTTRCLTCGGEGFA